MKVYVNKLMILINAEITQIRIKMEKVVFVCFVSFVMVSGHFKFYEMENTENLQVSEFEMEQENKPANSLSVHRTSRLKERGGNITNCGPKGYKLFVQWDPVTFNTQGTATFYWDVVSPCDINSGNAHIDVFLPEIPDSPIFSISQGLTCEDARKIFPDLHCPVKKNDEYKGQTVVTDLTRLPTGNYTIKGRLTNENEELCGCVVLNVELTH